METKLLFLAIIIIFISFLFAIFYIQEKYPDNTNVGVTDYVEENIIKNK